MTIIKQGRGHVTIAPDGAVSLAVLARNLGLTYRQADYWRQCDYIECEYRHRSGDPIEGDPDPLFPGSGYVSFVPPREVPRIEFMAALVLAGMEASAAARVADALIVRGAYRLGFGVEIRAKAGVAKTTEEPA